MKNNQILLTILLTFFSFPLPLLALSPPHPQSQPPQNNRARPVTSPKAAKPVPATRAKVAKALPKSTPVTPTHDQVTLDEEWQEKKQEYEMMRAERCPEAVAVCNDSAD